MGSDDDLNIALIDDVALNKPLIKSITTDEKILKSADGEPPFILTNDMPVNEYGDVYNADVNPVNIIILN